MQDRQLTLTRLIQASPDKVWRCWTDPSLIAQWFGPEGFRCTTKQIDLRAGGLWRFDMTGPDGTVWPNRHRITLYAPISRIEFLMDADSDDQPPMQVVVTLEPAVMGTLLTQTITFPTMQGKVAALGFGADDLGRQTHDKLARLAESSALA
jgi:uncharacterized protein YndB with AHSA1/START domain